MGRRARRTIPLSSKREENGKLIAIIYHPLISIIRTNTKTNEPITKSNYTPTLYSTNNGAMWQAYTTDDTIWGDNKVDALNVPIGGSIERRKTDAGKWWVPHSRRRRLCRRRHRSRNSRSHHYQDCHFSHCSIESTNPNSNVNFFFIHRHRRCLPACLSACLPICTRHSLEY